MNLNKIGIILLSLLGTIFFSACGDDSDFNGSDSYVTSFQLKQGDITLNASISADQILITAPDNLSLSGATVNFVVSENASIDPKPETITDWDTDRSFVVTAHDGTKSTYNYHVQRNASSLEGDIVLLTQEAVEEFAALKLTQVNGNLTIGASTGADSIHSLKSLSGLKTIGFSIIINPTYAGKNLEGFENIEKIGSLQIGDVKQLKNVDFPKLKSIMTDLNIVRGSVKYLNFPELKNIDKGLQIQYTDTLTSMSFPKLQSVVENVNIEASWSTNKLEAVNFPSLEKVGGKLNVSQWQQVTEVKFPLLKNAVTLSVLSLAKAKTVSFPQLASVYDMTVSACYVLTDMDFSSLKTVSGNFRIENISIANMGGLKALSSITGEFYASNLSGLKSSKEMALKSVGGRIYISSWPLLEDNIDGLASLNQIGGDIIISQIPFKKFSGFSLTKANKISLYGYVETINEIDLRNVTMTGLELSNISSAFALKGKDVCDFDVTWSDCNIASLVGFKELKSLNFSINEDSQTEATLNIEKVSNNLTFSTYYLQKASLPNLKEVGGTFNLSSPPKEIELPLLAKLGSGNLTVSSMKKFSLPSLKTVEGNLTIVSGNYNGDELEEISMPLLTTVNGTLDVSGYSNYYGNTKLKNLNGFSALTSVKGIKIAYNTSLTDFSGLKNILSSITASSWSVTYNAYNPTFQDMQDGKYVKP
ncbi:MAG: hypothetical protein ACK5M3_14010 [Dysgonomonas sp.]